MAWFKGLLGGMAGAFGYTQMSQYETKDIAQGLLGVLARDGSGGSKTIIAARVDPQMNELTKQLRELQMQLNASRSQPVTIVTGQSSNKGYGYIIVPTSVAGIVLLYLRYVKGWRIMDFMYVTRASLQGLKASVAELHTNMSAGITKMQEDVNQKTRLLAQHLGLVTQKQDDLLQQQQQLDGKLEQLGDDVDERMTNMHADVRGIQTDLGDIHNKVDLSTRGLFVLCHAIHDMCRSINFNGKSVAAIEGFLQGATTALTAPPPGAAAAQGGAAGGSQPAAIQGAPQLPALPAAASAPISFPKELEALLPLISEEPAAAPSSSVAPAPASGAPSTSTPTQGQASTPTQGQASTATSRNARAKSDATDSRSQAYRASPYFNMFSMGRSAANTRSASLPAPQL